LELVVARYGDTHQFAPHFHRGYSVAVQEEGELTFEHGRGTHSIGAGKVMTVNPLEVHSARTAGAGPWTTRSFYLDPGLMMEICGATDEPRPNAEFRDSVLRDVRACRALIELHRELETAEASAARVSSALARVLRDHVDLSTQRKTPVREAVLKAQEFLRRNLQETPSLAAIGAHVGLSPFHFLRVFKAHSGMTPHAWLMQERVERSLKLLQQGRPIAETSRQCGFADQSHLTRRFKQVLGVPPGTFVRGVRPTADAPPDPQPAGPGSRR